MSLNDDEREEVADEYDNCDSNDFCDKTISCADEAADEDSGSENLLEAVIIYSKKMKKVAAFYEEAMGFGPFLTYDHHMGCQIGALYFGIDEIPKGECVHKGTSNVSLWFTVDNVGETYERCLMLGAQMRHPPVLKPWGRILASCFDPDGNILGLMQREGIVKVDRESGMTVDADQREVEAQ